MPLVMTEPATLICCTWMRSMVPLGERITRFYDFSGTRFALARPVLRHRIITNFNAQSERVTTDQLIEQLVRAAVACRLA